MKQYNSHNTLKILFFYIIAFISIQIYGNEDFMNFQQKNHLQNEKSPYLQQHADNPVNWYPWGEDAFEKARMEDKPIFLSIGYSTCHWCHVMEKESFEDKEVAKLMNETFVSIKVDREEHPEIDSVYMNVCQLMTSSGGWPLTIIMTPDKKPFFAGTYIPKENRFGRTGLLQLIPAIAEAWKNRRKEIISSSNKITNTLNKIISQGTGLAEKELDSLPDMAFKQLVANYDSKNGGFEKAPKFPSPHKLIFLLRYYYMTGNDQALNMVKTTLKNIRRGGIFDQLGYGIHRYSTDSKWLIPHFEKMLYDQAMLIMAYTECFEVDGDLNTAQTAEEIIEYVLNNLSSSEGGFYTSEDADSSGEEGKYYLWTLKELKESLTEQEYITLTNQFQLSEIGNFITGNQNKPNGSNILFMKKNKNIDRTTLNPVSKKLLKIRELREHPFKDKKILTSWNGLMITALAKSGRILNKPSYIEKAEQAWEFISSKMFQKSKLKHSFIQGNSEVDATLDDYAFLTEALLELYQSTFKVKYLEKALELNKIILEDFSDKNNYGFYMTSTQNDSLIFRPKEFYDGALPSGNSIAVLNLIKLFHLTENTKFQTKANDILKQLSGEIAKTPSGYTMLLNAYMFEKASPVDIILATPKKDSLELKNYLKIINSYYIPNKTIIKRIGTKKSTAPPICKIAPFVKQCYPNIKTTIYFCENSICSAPFNSKQELILKLQKLTKKE
jgi:uncharacterized protein YyaL (SSP411 family)